MKAKVLQKNSVSPPSTSPTEPSGVKNPFLCQGKPSKRLTPVVSKPAYFHASQFKPNTYPPLTPEAPPGGKESEGGANLETGLQRGEKGNPALAAPFEMQRNQNEVGSGATGGLAVARRPSGTDAGRRRTDAVAKREPYGEPAPISSQIFVTVYLSASKRAKERIVVILPYWAERKSPS